MSSSGIGYMCYGLSVQPLKVMLKKSETFFFFMHILFIHLEKEMATHSSILAWRIPWTEELGGLQSTGCKESDTTQRLLFHFHTFGKHRGGTWEFSFIVDGLVTVGK